MNKFNVPDYSDGMFELFTYKDNDDVYPIKELKTTGMKIWFQELSVSDSLRSTLNQNDVDVTLKIRIPQYKKLKPIENVVSVSGEYHSIYNLYHFTNKDGIKQTDITLVRFKND